MFTAQRNASMEMFKCAAHLALGISGIRQPAKSACLCFGRFRALGVAEAALVLLSATLDVSERKKDIAAKMMNAR